MSMPVSETKPTLHQIREQHYFDIPALAERAGVAPSVLDRMLARQPVQRYLAELVLSALADECGEDYTLETVEIVLFPEADQAEP